MVSKRQKIFGVIVAVIVIMASFTFILLNQPEPILDQMLIHTGDIEPGWHELDRRSDSVIQTFENTTSAQRVIMVKNSTYYMSPIFTRSTHWSIAASL